MKSSILILCALLCLSAVSCGGNGDDGQESDTKGTTPVVTEPKETDPALPETEPAQKETEPETEPVTEPETEAQTELVTEPAVPDLYPELPEDPVPDAVPGGVPVEGQFASEGNKNLVLLADWSCLRTEDGTFALTVTVGLSHYEIYAQEKIDQGAIYVNGEEHLFSTSAISYDGAGRTYTELYTETIQIPDEGQVNLGLKVSWDILAFYGGQQVDTLTAEGLIPVAAGETFG